MLAFEVLLAIGSGIIRLTRTRNPVCGNMED